MTKPCRVLTRLKPMASPSMSRAKLFGEIHEQVSSRIALLKKQEEEVGRLRRHREREMHRLAQIDASRQ